MAFKIKAGAFGRFETIEIRDDELGHQFIFVPDKGALPIKMRYFNLDFVESIETPEILDSDHWFRNFWLMPYPNRTENGVYSFQGKKYHLEMSTHDKNHALHGFFHKLWAEDIEVKQHSDYIELVIKHMYHADQPGFPFPFDASIRYTIHNNGILKIEVNVLNTGENPMPFGLGWHPYFKLDRELKELEVSTNPLTHILLNDLSIPTGVNENFDQTVKMLDSQLDDCFKYQNEPYTFLLKSENYQLRIEQSKEFEYLQIFTPGRGSVAIEPMTCGVNALNTQEGLVVLNPGDQKSYHLSVELKKL